MFCPPDGLAYHATNLHQRPREDWSGAGTWMSRTAALMRLARTQEQAVTPQREIAPKQEQGQDLGIGI